MKLGEAMVREGLITNEVLARALERQIIFGGRLGTNLVEMGAISEETLAKFLSKSMGVPYAGPESFGDVDREAIDSFPTDLAQKYTAFPIKKEGSRLHLAMKDPNDFPALDELKFIIGLTIKPYIASELRIAYALEKFYGIKRNLRYVSVHHEDEKEKPGISPKTAANTPSPKDEPESSFEYLGDESQAEFIGSNKALLLDDEPHSAPPPVAPPKEAPAPAPTAPAPLKASASNPYEALAFPTGRDHIAETIVAAARQDLRRVALFLVKGAQVSGWKADGEGVDLGKALSLEMGISGPAVFREVVEEKVFYRGPVLRVPQNAPLFEVLKGVEPCEAIAFPLLIKGKVVGVLYGDNGRDSMIVCDIRKLEGLMAKASMSLEILILRNKILN